MSTLFYSQTKNQLLLLAILLMGNSNYVNAKPVIGWIETVKITKDGYEMIAKIDTGADYSSINVLNVTKFTKNGMRWVEFTIRSKAGKKVVLSKKILRYVRIKMKNRNGFQRRVVVNMTLCLGTTSKLTQVNLVDRSRYKYQLLIGRSFLRNSFLVDSSFKNLARNNCK